MEESLSSVKSCCRKRKEYPPSTHFSGRLTRKKSQIYVHQNRSGRARLDEFSRKPISIPPKSEPAKADFDVSPPNALQGLCTKDLRRQRIFTPDVCSNVVEDENKEQNLNEVKELLKGSDVVSCSGQIPDLGFCDMEVDESRMEDEDEKVNEEKELLNDSDVVSCSGQISDSDLDLCDLDVDKSQIEEKDDNLNERKELLKGFDTDLDTGRILDSVSVPLDVDEDKKADEPRLQKSKDETISGSGSISKAKTIVGPCKRRKVFITPNSFSYRRLLPYLNNMVDDDSSISKLDIIDAGIPHKLQKPVGLKSELLSIPEGATVSKVESHSNHTKPLVNANLPCNQQDLSGVENELGQTKKKIMENFASRSDGSSMEEEFCQMTPPDPDLISTMEVGIGGETTEANNVSTENQIHEDFSVGEGRSNRASLKETINCISTNNRMGLNPCRLRVFKNPKSFSYRRLLPLLTDMAKNDSGASTTIQQQKPVLDLKEDKHPVSASTAEENNVTEITTHISNENHQTENCNQNSLSAISPPAVASSSSDHLSNDEPIPLFSETIPDLDLKITPPELESELPHKEGIDEANAHNKIGDSIEKVSDALVTPASCSPPKGILKRNPRGCRGPCNCLSCASFRLHSERAFEFSFNQMRDAEEIATELMKEVASLRNLLEKTVVNENDLAVIQLDNNSVEIRQACNKALETENLAKARLSQLNYELSIHCRVPDLVQPGVTFAHYVQEKAIPRLNVTRKPKIRLHEAL